MKRILLGMGLGLLWGILCFTGFSSGAVENGMGAYASWSFSNPMMWTILVNRIVLGFVVAIAGFITVHPFLGFKVPPVLRGAKLGALISLTMAIGVFMGPDSEGAWTGFWMIVIAGALIGAITDIIITKVVGEGDILRK